MIAVPKSGMVLAAGLGTRMRPLSQTVPKPLIEIGGQTLLDHAIDRLALAGVERVVVNVHYKADLITARLAARPQPPIEISHEEQLLETGGGVLKALPLLGETFFVLNSDVLWLDGKDYALIRLAGAFDEARMDAVLLLQRTTAAVGYEGSGDFFLDPLGTPRCETADNDLVNPGTAEVNPVHQRKIDLVGHRYHSEDNRGYVIGVEAQLLF